MVRFVRIGFVFLSLGIAQILAGYGKTRIDKYSNIWVMEVPAGENTARRVARDLGFSFKGQAYSIEDHYMMTRDDLPEESASHSQHLTERLLAEDDVKWAEQQKLMKMKIKGAIPEKNDEIEHGELASRSTRDDDVSSGASLLGKLSTRPTRRHLRGKMRVTKSVRQHSSKPSAYTGEYNDPLWPKQWNMHDYRTEEYPVMDHNVVPVHRMGFTGKGVTVAVVDTGVEEDHPDLAGNYVKELSFNAYTKESTGAAGKAGKQKRLGHVGTMHGTNSAGVIAMVANNSICGVGFAPDARVAGIAMADEGGINGGAAALTHKMDEFDIYSNSWGNDDEGEVIFYLQQVIAKVIAEGVTRGRGGLGVVHMFASGNGRARDDCGADSLMSNLHVIVVGAVSPEGKVAWYSEACANVMVATYSGMGEEKSENIVTVQMEGKCYEGYTGTSAATPAASGMIALLLQANPKLGYRDVQHILTMSAEVAPLADNPRTWTRNSAGFWVSNDFGFGLMNAENMVLLGLQWKNVPKTSEKCEVERKLEKKLYFDWQEPVYVDINTGESCDGVVTFLEHVELSSSIEYMYRGALEIKLVSPSGTRAKLMQPRRRDVAREGLDNFSVTSSRTWGENPKGVWFVEVEATLSLRGLKAFINKISHTLQKPLNPGPPGYQQMGYVKGFKLTMHGLKEPPPHQHMLPRSYAGFVLPEMRTDRA